MSMRGQWRSHDYAGVWRFGPAWARPLVAAAPWIAALVALVLFVFAHNSISRVADIDFDLPPGETGTVGETVSEASTAVMIPMSGGGGTFVFFNDERYRMTGGAVAGNLLGALSARFASTHGTLLLLADRRVASGDVMALVDAARKAGVRHVRVAEKAN